MPTQPHNFLCFINTDIFHLSTLLPPNFVPMIRNIDECNYECLNVSLSKTLSHYTLDSVDYSRPFIVCVNQVKNNKKKTQIEENQKVLLPFEDSSIRF